QPNTQYFLRAFATNSVGTGYGNEISFSTLDGVADIDGNIYNRITIGTQVWLQENLKMKRYRNGDEIATTDPPTKAIADEVGANYYWSYNASESNEDAYGLLYTYSTVTDARGLCPAGWHVPTINEFETMIIALGGSAVAGGKLKTTGTEFWNEPNTGATNESGFTALPGGFKNAFGPFNSLKEFGWFWTTTETSATNATAFRLDNQSTEVAQGSALKNAGFSVRCVKD